MSEQSISFEQLGVSKPTVENLLKLGFEKPTPIQVQSIPVLLKESNDFIGLASTGTGKTAAFGIPLIENIDPDKKKPQALILCPTRELALQVSDQLQQIGRHQNLKLATIYGGASYQKQTDSINRGAQVIVATPGRLVDFLEQKLINLSQVHTLILDEADEMISMGFQEDLEFILKATHNNADSSKKSTRANCKTWLFSATMSQSIRRIADRYLHEPKTAQINRNQGLSSTVEQIYYASKNSNKLEVLSRILQTTQDFYGIIFCQTKQQVAEIDEMLRKRGFDVDCLHGDKTQKDREITLRKFKEGKTKVIVATDVAARGLDIKELTHIINFNLPWDVESYIHRSGRTGRNNQKGVAISLVSPEEMNRLIKIQRVTKVPMRKESIPTSESVTLVRIKAVENELTQISESNIMFKKAMDFVKDSVSISSDLSQYSPLELFARALIVYHPEVFNQSEHSLEISTERRFNDSSRGYRRPSHFGGRKENNGSGSKSFRSNDRPPRYSKFKKERT